jgi:tetratricopeptide (TPR) repeat protein
MRRKVRVAFVAFGVVVSLAALATPAFARSKNRSAAHADLAQIEQALKAGDLATAQSVATAIYQQDTTVASPQAPAVDVIIDPALATESAEHMRCKTACQIAEIFYRHAELDTAKQWAQTAVASGTLNNQYVRQATVLLGDIAVAMDRDDEAVTNYVSVITLKNQFREQPAAYAGLLELLMLRKEDELVEQWVRHGQDKYEGAGGLELDFLKAAAQTLKRRNHPLWNELDQQIVDLTPEGKSGKLQALRELASNARKFGRYAEAETNYAAICAMPLKSAEEAVNAHLFLAECQAKQAKDITPTLQLLQSKASAFTNSVDREYATYRVAKFYEDQGRSDLAQTNYSTLVSSPSTSTWAAASLHQLAALKEKQGDLQTALQLYLQYPQRFPQNGQLVLQAYANALNVTDTRGDTIAASQIVSAITNRAAVLPDYNVHLNLAHHYQFKSKQYDLAQRFLASGLNLASQALARTTDPDGRYEIHYRVLRRLSDFGRSQDVLDYFTANSNDLGSIPTDGGASAYGCVYFKAVALYGAGRTDEAKAQFDWLLHRVTGHAELETVVGSVLAVVQMQTAQAPAATALFEGVAERYPTHPWANLGRLYLAADKYKQGDVGTSLKRAQEIIATSSGTDKTVWVRKTYWSAVYIRGACLKAQGELEQGVASMQEALSHGPDLEVLQRLGVQL